MKAKNVVVMGGTIFEPGNITPVGEFNCIADPNAAARVYALTSPNPASTMPPDPTLPHYPSKDQLGDRRLNVIMFPLDVTSLHVLRRDQVEAKTKPLIEKGSPLAEWVYAFWMLHSRSLSLFIMARLVLGVVLHTCVYTMLFVFGTL